MKLKHEKSPLANSLKEHAASDEVKTCHTLTATIATITATKIQF